MYTTLKSLQIFCLFNYSIIYLFIHLNCLFIPQSVIMRLKTGLQLGNEKTIAAGFNKWRDYTRNYARFRFTTLQSFFHQVQHFFNLLT